LLGWVQGIGLQLQDVRVAGALLEAEADRDPEPPPDCSTQPFVKGFPQPRILVVLQLRFRNAASGLPVTFNGDCCKNCVACLTLNVMQVFLLSLRHIPLVAASWPSLAHVNCCKSAQEGTPLAQTLAWTSSLTRQIVGCEC
jgi:hypothetical protein